MRRRCLFRGVLLAVAILFTVIYLLLPQGIPALDAVLGQFINVRRVDVFNFRDTNEEERCFKLNPGTVSTDAIPKVVHVIWLSPELTFIKLPHGQIRPHIDHARRIILPLHHSQ